MMGIRSKMRIVVYGMACAGLIFGWGTIATGMGDDEDDHYGPRSAGAAAALIWNEEMKTRHGDNPDVLLLPGLVADRKTGEVEVLIEATGLPPGDTPEFIVIDQASSHGYEAVFWSMAKPSDIHRGLVFIGLESGGAVNPTALRFWAHGDRVMAGIRRPDGDVLLSVEEAIFDQQTGTSLPEEGFVFTGSIQVTTMDKPDELQYAADVYDPRSVIPLYNDPGAVLDVPRQAQQGEVYGRYVINPDFSFPGGEMLHLVLTAAVRDGTVRRREFVLEVTATNRTADLMFHLREGGDEAELVSGSELTPILEKLVGQSDKMATPFLTLDFKHAVPVGSLGRLSRLLILMETMNQVRVQPPLDRQLYYRAFVPSPDWAKPEGRPSQPWELHLGKGEGAEQKVELVLHELLPSEKIGEPGFERKAQPIESPATLRMHLLADALRREMEGRSQLPAVILVFTYPELAYGTLMEYVAPLLDLYGTIYIFAEPPELVINLEGDE